MAARGRGRERVKGRGLEGEKAVAKRTEKCVRILSPRFLRPISFLSPPVPHFFFLHLFGCTNLQLAAGWHGGPQRCQVDVSARLPSLCLPKSLHNKTPKRASDQESTHTHTLAHQECCPHSGENANARMAVVVLKENDPGRQAPSTRQGQGGQRRDKQTAYSPHRSLPHDPPPPLLSLSYFPLFQHVSFSFCSP